MKRRVGGEMRVTLAELTGHTPKFTTMLSTFDSKTGFEFRRRTDGLVINWTVYGELTKEEAEEFQHRRGFASTGYGFYCHEIRRGKTRWQCMSSC